MDMNKPTADRFEIGLITRDASGQVVQKRLEGAELDQMLSEAKVFEDLEKAKKWTTDKANVESKISDYLSV